MRTVSGLFETYAEARVAIHRLEDAGIRTADISLVANNADGIYPGDASPVGKDATAGAEVGALLGGAGGLLVGLGVLAIPGVGPVLAGGWLFATVIGAVAGAGLGAATGSLIGVLTDAGIPKSDAHVYAEGVRRGGALVSARVGEAEAQTAARLLAEAGAKDPVGLRTQYEGEGWKDVDEAASDPAEAELTHDRDSRPIVPPVI
jgi:hypothetical protein